MFIYSILSLTFEARIRLPYLSLGSRFYIRHILFGSWRW